MALMANERLSLRRFLAEGAVIVASILLAFAIDAVWDLRQDRERENVLIDSLTREFRANRLLLAATIDSVEIDRQTVAALFALTPTEVAALPPDTAWDYLNDAWTTFTSELFSGAITSALSSGDLRYLRDNSVRESVAGWPGKVADVTERVRVMVRQEEIVQDAIDRIPGAAVVLQNRGGSGASYWLSRIRADEPAMSRVARQHFLTLIFQRQLRELLERADSTLALLDRTQRGAAR